jgi:hypothetical protein
MTADAAGRGALTWGFLPNLTVYNATKYSQEMFRGI